MSPQPCAKVQIVLFDGALPNAVEAIEEALVDLDPSIVQRNGTLYIKCSEGIIRATAQRLRLSAMRVADFLKGVTRPQPHFVPVDPALKYFEALRRKREWKFPSLTGDPSGGEK